MPKAVLEIKKLKKSYSKTIAVNDLSLTVNEGEIIGLIGPNGAGKSTTIKCALGLLNKDEGEIKFFGRDITKEFEKIMTFVGYVPSENSMYENMKVIDFFRYSNSFYEVDFYPNILTLSQRLDLDLQKKIGDLSLGNKRKVSIINALFHEPQIIIFDEPTNGLDPLSRLEFEKILKEEKKKGTAILYSSHNLNEVQNLCDNVLIIKNGELIPDVDASALKNAHKKIVLESNKQLEKKYFNIEGIKNLEIEQFKATFLYAGNMANLIHKLDSLDLSDLQIENPNLEEVFLHYYNK